MNNSNKKHLELLLKAVSGFLGVLYVLGILITNLQLLELGLADFSSLRTRNIIIGFTFLVYLAFIPIVVSTISATLSVCFNTITNSELKWKTKLFYLICTVPLGFFGFAITCYFVGTIIGWMFPWGQPWLWGARDWSSLESWLLWKSDLYTAYTQFGEAYLHPKVIAASCAALLVLTYFLTKSTWLRGFSGLTPQPSQNQSAKFMDIKYLKWYFYYFFSMFFALALVGYSNEVYPNIKYNLGGGQPTLAQLNLKKADIVFEELLGKYTAADTAGQIVMTKPLVLWYRDDNFLYISPIPSQGDFRQSVVAIDSKTVRAIRYLQGYVRVKSGGQIVASELY